MNHSSSVPPSKEMRGICEENELSATQAGALMFEVGESWILPVKQERRDQEKLGPATKHRPDPSRRMQFG